MGEKEPAGARRHTFLQGAGTGLAIAVLGGALGTASWARRSSHADMVLHDGNVLKLSGEFGPHVVFDAASAPITQATAPAAASRAARLNTHMAVGCCDTEAGRHGARI